MYVRMVIAECVSADQVKEFSRIFRDEVEPTLTDIPGFARSELVTEDGGNMVIVQAVFDSRNHCLVYHTSRAYRQFVAKTQHLLLGNFVGKLFQTEPPQPTG